MQRGVEDNMAKQSVGARTLPGVRKPPRSAGFERGRRTSIRKVAAASVRRGYPDLHEHLDALRKRGLLLTIDRPVDKDAELHPLVRWQFVGGIEEHERKAFLFTNVVDG